MREGFRWAVPLLVTALLCASSGTAWAFPPWPASFYGQVQITDFTVAAGDHVLAYVPDVAGQVGQGAIQQYAGGLVYTIDVNGDDEDTPAKDGGVAGDTITFKIGDQVVMEAPWAEGNHYRPIHPPAAVLQTNSPVNEGALVTLDASTSADAGNDIASYAFDCNGDGVPDGEPGTVKTTTCTFYDGPSTHSVGVRVVDGQGGVSTRTASMIVSNVLPTVTLPPDGTIDEGATFSGSGSFGDPGVDTWTATVNYGDGSGTGGLTLNGDKTFMLSHLYDDNGANTITVAVADGDGSGSKTMQVSVLNAPPTATFAATSPIPAGGDSTLSFSAATDPSSADRTAGLHYSFACDGQTASLAATYALAGDTTKACTFPTEGSYPVKGRIFDKDEGYTDYDLQVVVQNVAPVVSITSATTPLNEGSEFTGGGSFSHPGDETCTATVDYGDGSGAVPLPLTADKTFSLSHTYSDNGSFTVKVTVTDAARGAGEASQPVTVNNVVPTATFSASDAVNEGSPIELTLTNPQDPSPLDTTAGFQYAFDCGAGLGVWSTTHTASCPTSAVGSRTVQARIKDKDGGETGYSNTVVIRDVVPANANAGQLYAAIAGDPVMLSGSADNCLAIDGCTFTWKQGTTLLGIGASLSHRWNHTGSYPVTLEVSDDDSHLLVVTTEVTIAGRERSITLQPGWNLVSFNVIPDDRSIAKVFESIAGQWDLAYAWDGASQGWRRADLVDYLTDTLSELDEKQGFWIHITAATAIDFEIAGSLPDGDTQIPLFGDGQGWNMVSLPAGEDKTLSHTAIPNLSMVYQYRAGEAMPWRLYDVAAPDWSNDLSAMSPYYGYWVKVTGDGTWSVPYGEP